MPKHSVSNIDRFNRVAINEVVKVVITTTTTTTLDEITITMANKSTMVTVDVIHEAEAMVANNNADAAMVKVTVKVMAAIPCTMAIQTTECEPIEKITKTESKYIRQTTEKYSTCARASEQQSFGLTISLFFLLCLSLSPSLSVFRFFLRLFV